MLPLTPINFIAYFSVAWGANIALNLIYVIKRYFPETKKYDYPLDCGLKYRKERLLGDSITMQGLIISLIISLALEIATQQTMWTIVPLAVYGGDILGSFIKRRLHCRRGDYLPIIDHGNYMILLGLIFLIAGYADIWFVLLAILLNYILHPLACWLAFKLKLRQLPY